jgi:lipid-A-disaccharide synthase
MDKIKIFIIAGEPSGDVLGAKLMAEIKNQSDCEVEFYGVGGSKMQNEGIYPIFDMADLSLMGFAEVIPHIPKLLRRIKQTAEAIIRSGIKMVITIDSPDFCFRVIKKLNSYPKSKNIKKVHLVAPTVWAYRPRRAKKIAKLYDLLLAILPFEPPYFNKYGLETLFIGHPITENNKLTSEQNLCLKYQIKESDFVICAMIGSRVGEVKRILPEVIGAINILSQKYPNLVVLIPTIIKTKSLIQANIVLFNVKTILLDEDEKYLAFKTANFAIAKSGTNNLEIAIAKLPMITIYKINPITHFFIKRIILIKFANLINIILNKELIPELLQDNCCANKIAIETENFIANPQIMQNQINKSQNVLKILGLDSSETPSAKAAKRILELYCEVATKSAF